MSAANGGNGQAPTTPASSSADENGQAPTTAPHNSGSLSTAPNGQAPTANTETYAPPSADEWKRHQQELAEARREAAALRTEKRQRDDANLTAQQKLERDYTDLQTWRFEHEAETQRLHLENASLRLAPSLGIADPALALAVIQQEHAAEIKYGADGRPENLSDLFKQVLKEHPALAAQTPSPQRAASSAAASSGGGATNPGRQAGSGSLTIEMIRAMSPRERMARIDEVNAWYKANT